MLMPLIASELSVKRGIFYSYVGLALANILMLFNRPVIIIFSSLLAMPSSFLMYYTGYYDVKRTIIDREKGLKDMESASNLGFIVGYLIGLVCTSIYGYIIPVYIALIVSLLPILFSTSSSLTYGWRSFRFSNLSIYNTKILPNTLNINKYTQYSGPKIDIHLLKDLLVIRKKYRRMVYFLALVSTSIGFSYTYLTPYLALKGVESNRVYLFTLIASTSTYFSIELSTKIYLGLRSIPKMLIPRIISYISTLIFLMFLVDLADFSLFIMYIPIGFSWGFLLALNSFLLSRVDSREHSKINFYTGIVNLLSVVVAGIIFYNYGLFPNLIIALVTISIALIFIYKNPYIIKGYNGNQRLLHIYLRRIGRITLQKKKVSR